MNQSKKRRIVCLLAALAVAAGLWRGLPALAGRAYAVSQSDISAMEDDLDDLAQEMDRVEDQLAAIQDDKTKALEQKALLDEQIALISKEIAQTDAILAEYDGLIAAKEAEISDLEAQEQAQYELFCAQMRSMEERGTVSYLSILFSSSSFEEMLDNAMLIGEIMDYSNEVITMLQNTQAELELARTELEEGRADQQAVRDQQAEAKAELDVQRAEAADLVNRILAQESEYQAALDEVEAEEERIQAEIVRLSQELAAQQAAQGQTSNAALGGYIWPVSSRKINSPFGQRDTGIPGASTNHKGVDIGGVYYSSEVHAAKAGTVIISQSSSSYGEYVVISHGSGNTTLYAHMSSRSVSVGDVVEQGDVIGITGSTGISSGPHLHFEITENGVRVDPLQYLTGYIKNW